MSNLPEKSRDHAKKSMIVITDGRDLAAAPAAREKRSGAGGGCQVGRDRSWLDMFLFLSFVLELMLIRVVESDTVF
jgi:hypothetical protein